MSVLENGNQDTSTEQTTNQMGGAVDNDAYGRSDDQDYDDRNDDRSDDSDNSDDTDGVDFLFGDEVLADDDTTADDLETDRDDDTPAIKQMRATLRDYKQQLKQRQQPTQAAVTTPVQAEFNEPEPQLQDEGIDFDPAKFSEAWKAWNNRKSEHEQAVNKQREQAEQLQQTLIGKQKAYYAGKAEIVAKVPGYEAAEKVVLNEIPEMLQATVLLHSENPNMAVLALGRNKDLRDKLLKAQSDPVALGRLIGMIDAKARLAPRRKVNDLGDVPEVKGEGGASITALEAEIEKARKSNDYTRVIQLKNQLAKRKQKDQ